MIIRNFKSKDMLKCQSVLFFINIFSDGASI